MPSVKLKAPAKINLTLDVLGKREDGYHYMKMVMQTVNLYNTVTVGLSGTEQNYLYCNDSEVPGDQRNLAWKAAGQFFADTGIRPQGLDISLEKAIPMEAGLAGGSADGAAVLVGLNQLFGAGLTQEQLCQIGVKVGADVPYCIVGGTMLSEGIGDLFTHLPTLPDCYIVIAKPKEGMRTPECFARLDQIKIGQRPDADAMAVALASQDLEEIGKQLGNVFEQVVHFESIPRLKRTMREMGAKGACMTGSGTAVFGLFDNKRTAKHCLSKMMGMCKSVFLTRPVPNGAALIEARA